MSTYLQLVNLLKDESGSRAADLTTAIGLTGEGRRFANWINAAWMDIQGKHQDWGWKRTSTSFVTVNGQATYTPAQAGTTNFGMWSRDSFRNYLTATGTDAEVEMEYIDYEAWRNHYQLGSNRTSYSQPHDITITPAKSLGLGPVPLVGYTVTGDYFTCPTEMTADADIPALPVHYHMAIVYRALMYYAANEAASEVYNHGKTEFNRLMTRIENDYLPEVTLAGPLC
ncbi:MAG: hypothetical protein WC208_13575 [Gallionella sp.]|jgi:hypothetical protein